MTIVCFVKAVKLSAVVKDLERTTVSKYSIAVREGSIVYSAVIVCSVKAVILSVDVKDLERTAVSKYSIAVRESFILYVAATVCLNKTAELITVVIERSNSASEA